MSDRNSTAKQAIKFLKIALAFAGGSFLLLVLASFTISVFFAEDINQKVKEEINRQLEATVDYKGFSLTLISNFPDITLKLEQFLVVGKNEFARDTLLQVKEFDCAVNVWNVLRGEKLKVSKLIFKEPNIFAHKLSNGKANWASIVKPDTAAPQAKTDSSNFEFALSRIALRKANIRYKDDSSYIDFSARALDFTGKGDFTANNYDLATNTSIKEVSLLMEKTRYINKASFNADIALNIDNAKQQYSFRENKITVNDFQFNFDGFIKFIGDKLYTDLKFNTLKTDFKNLLSLIPEVYVRDYQKIKTEGAFQLEGWCKGKLDSVSYPAFNLNLVVSKGLFQYPDLPAPIQNIDVDLQVMNDSERLENLQLNLKKFHAELENNPIDFQLHLRGLNSPYIEANGNIRVDLAKITRVFPIPDMELRGQLGLEAKAKGKMAENNLPVCSAKIDLKYGYVKYASFPSALENLAIAAAFDCPTGRKEDVKIKVSNFHTELDKEPIEAKLEVQNIIDPIYNLYLQGKLDLEKLTKIYPIEGSEIKGQIVADLKTEGTVSALQNARYADLPSSGFINVSNLFYNSRDLPKPFELSSAKMNFTPKHIHLTECKGQLGSSDFSLEGKLENYMGYLFANQILNGDLQLASQRINLNEFTSGELSQDPTTGDTTTLAAPELPANLNFLFAAHIKELLYDNLDLQNFRGSLLLQNQTLSLVGLKFNLLGGAFIADAKYIGVKPKQPHVEFKCVIDSMRIKDMFRAFSSVKAYAPIAKDISGTLSCGLTFSGDLTGNLMPNYESITSMGKAFITKADLTQTKIIQQLSGATQLAFFNQLKAVTQEIGFKILNGRLYVDPFTIRVQDVNMHISGSNGLDKSLNYTVKLDVPAPALTGQAIGALSKLSGYAIEAPQRLNIDLAITGNMDSPKIGVKKAGAEGGPAAKVVADLKNKAQAEAEAELMQRKKEAEEKARQEFERLQKDAQDKLREAEERKRQELERARIEAEKKAQEELEKKKQEAENKAKEEAKKLKDKIKFPR
jgi:vacuolar-type H+-ATPase subunit H